MSSVEDSRVSGLSTVYAVDDEPVALDMLRQLLESEGYRVEACGSGKEFLHTFDHHRNGCVLMNIRLPDMNGLDVQAQLVDRGVSIPVIMVTDHGDVPMAVQALKAGAVDIVERPYHCKDILSSVREAIKHGNEVRQGQLQIAELEERYERLTPRERQIMQLVVDGHLNKQIAAELGLSRKTIEIHRANVMHKMKADSLAALVRMSVALDRELPHWREC